MPHLLCLEHTQYFLDGRQSAREIIDWTEKYLSPGQIRVLDFGCGVSRIVIHLKSFLQERADLYGCDVNERMIAFNKSAYPEISYCLVPLDPPTSYETGFFDLVYAISIFTHIRATAQDQWLKEIHRILKKNGIFLLTTHGKYFYPRLLKTEKELLDREGTFTKNYGQEGHRMMSTYHTAEGFKNLLLPYFEILEFYDASIDSSKTGGQDLWIVKKRDLVSLNGSN